MSLLEGRYANRNNRGSDFKRNRKSYSFFRKKPRLGLKPRENAPIDITVARRNQNDEVVDPHTFKANIWVLEINNIRLQKISKSAAECSSTLHIRNLGAEIPLRWQTYLQEPKGCFVNEVPFQGEPSTAPYNRLMPYNYAVVELAQRHAAPTTSIHVGETYGLYFLFTHEGSNHAFIITPLEWPQWYGDNEVFYPSIHGMFLFINQGEEREMTVTFKSNPKGKNQDYEDVNHIKFRMKFNSWDDIEII